MTKDLLRRFVVSMKQAKNDGGILKASFQQNMFTIYLAQPVTEVVALYLKSVRITVMAERKVICLPL